MLETPAELFVASVENTVPSLREGWPMKYQGRYSNRSFVAFGGGVVLVVFVYRLLTTLVYGSC